MTLAGQGNVARAGGTAGVRAGSTREKGGACGYRRACAGSTARAELDRPFVRVLAVHNEGGVSRHRDNM